MKAVKYVKEHPVFKEHNQKNFAVAANEAVKSEFRNGAWAVWEDYEVIETMPGKDAYVRASDDSEYEVYYPLAQVPGLFLEFATLADKEITREVWLDWISRYGVLGLNWRDPVRDMVAIGFFGPVSLTGGPAESYRHFVGEAKKANQGLRLYEAIASPKGPRASHSNRGSEIIEKFWRDVSLTEARERPLEMLHSMVGVEIEDCYPILNYFPREERFAQGWGFRTVTAAMYLQMMWLLTATGEEVRWCKRPECDKVITFKQPEQLVGDGLKKNDRGKGYKTRRDKEFCDPNCKGQYHYYYVKKRKK